MPSRSHLKTFLVVVLAGLAAAACVDEKIVFQDRELFEELPPGAADFIGYTDMEAKLVVCGNCHVGQQGKWESTKHADAFNTLVESGHSQSFCEDCHAVSELGSPAAGMVGWTATQDERFHDVQCESCHGPGLAHLEDPGLTQPYAAMNVGTDGLAGCGECHTGSHHPFAEEWASSAHAVTDNHAQERESCAVCHEARGVLAGWGITNEYSDKDDTEVIPITCGVCHDPHGSDNPSQLRFPINSPVPETNLCMKCHHKRSEPDQSSSRGAHSPQGPLLVGEDVGWVPPLFTYAEGITGTHGSTANPNLCAGCHVNRFEVTDAESGEFLFQATGHGFKGTPCLAADGVPSGEDDCLTTERSYAACAVSGCHGSENGARSAMIAAWSRFELLTQTVDAMVAQVPSTEFVTNDNLITTGEGAKFNSGLGKLRGTAAHNPFLIEALLTASIRQLTADYGIAAPAGLDLSNTYSDPAN